MVRLLHKEQITIKLYIVARVMPLLGQKNSMFLSNKYTKWYFEIIINAQNKKRIKNANDYFEKHHIIPKCMGGTNDITNLVLLTAREHFICHLLLCKMVGDPRIKNKLIVALLYFKGNTSNMRRYVNSYLYEKSRSLYIKNIKMFDDATELERRQKISIKMKETLKKRDYSYTRTEEWREKLRIIGINSHKNRIYKFKNNPNVIPKQKKTSYYKDMKIYRDGIEKIIKNNQYPQYKKFGWSKNGGPNRIRTDITL